MFCSVYTLLPTSFSEGLVTQQQHIVATHHKTMVDGSFYADAQLAASPSELFSLNVTDRRFMCFDGPPLSKCFLWAFHQTDV